MYKLIRMFSLVLLGLCFLQHGIAQSDLSQTTIPTDPKVKIGKLDNGFTYYIRENYKPEKRVEMQLVVNTGSILEDEDQLGLAHFVEHMAFNGTKNFEKNELKNYLESIGMRFGAELNAHTSFDETVYKLTIPSDSAELLDKGFLVMEDWAFGLSFDHEEIDKERGVIIEEWRIGQGYMQRMRDKFMPVVFTNSRYAERLPIGSKEIIENCSYETLKSFYTDWYRPDLMALVVVGDIDAEYVEKKIIEHFSDYKVADDARERQYYDVYDNEEMLTCILTDKEAPYNMILLMNKAEPFIQETQADYLQSLRYSFLTGMLNRRLAELAELEQPPYIGANVSYFSLVANKMNTLWATAATGENGIETALKTLLTEAERIDRHGYTQGEFERYKLDLIKRYENAFNERDKTESRSYMDEYKRNYLEQEPIPGIEFEYEFVKKHIKDITVEEINTLANELLTEDNRVVVILAPDNPDNKVPDRDGVLEIAEEVSKSDIEKYTDKLVANELMADQPEPGSIVSETKLEELDALDITLSNGARIILKSTQLKNDEVLFSAYSPGGHSVYPDSDHFTALNTDGIVKESGVGDFSASDISKVLAGKTVYVAPVIGYDSESITAQTKTSDIESMLQLVHLYFTNPRVDESAFNSFVNKKRDLFSNLVKEPQNYFFDKYYRIKAQDHPRGDYIPEPEEWDNINFKRAIDIYHDRFADAGNFTFIMVGSFDIEMVKPMIEKYIASLPSIDRSESYVDLQIRPPYEKTIRNIYKGSDPKSLAILYFEKEEPWNEYDAYMLGVFNDILRMRYIDVLREEMSGVYSVRNNASLNKIPYEHASLQILIPCAPDNTDSLIYTAIREVKSIQENGVSAENIQKAREARKRSMETNKQKNQYWLKAIQEAVVLGTDLESVAKDDFIEKISSDEVQRVANKYIDADRYLQVVLYPEEPSADQ